MMMYNDKLIIMINTIISLDVYTAQTLHVIVD